MDFVRGDRFCIIKSQEGRVISPSFLTFVALEAGTMFTNRGLRTASFSVTITGRQFCPYDQKWGRVCVDADGTENKR